ncbi:hypothetical protein Hte_009625 [Hypoxylon texense]
MGDDNILGITAPSTTTWLPWECARAELDSLIRQQPVPMVRLAHVEGPHGSGKSTGMLEYISQEVRTVSPETMVIYVPSLDHEATLLCAYFRSVASTHAYLRDSTLIGLQQDTESTLHLATIPQLRKVLRQDIFEPTLPNRVALLLDLEQAPTADGELLLCELVRWCRDRLSDSAPSQRRLSELTLITMATFSRPPVHKLLAEHLQAQCRHIVMKEGGVGHGAGQSTSLSAKHLPLVVHGVDGIFDTVVQLYAIEPTLEIDMDRERCRKTNAETSALLTKMASADPENELEILVSMLNLVEIGGHLMQGDKQKGSCAVIFMDTDDDELYEPLVSRCGQDDIGLSTIRKGASLVQLVDPIIYQGPQIVCVHPDFPYALFIPRVVAITSYMAVCDRMVFDVSIGQFLLTRAGWSRMDLWTAQSYALKSWGPEAGEIPFYYHDDGLEGADFEDHFDHLELTSYAPAYDSEVMRLSLEICAPWPDRGADRRDDGCLAPLPAVSDARLLSEMWRRLVNMGCLRYLPDCRVRPALNGPRALRALEYLEETFAEALQESSVEFNVALAYFMAGIEDAGSNSTKRVMARIAALIMSAGDIHYSTPVQELQAALEDLKGDPQSSAELTKKLRAEVAAACRGVGARESHRGVVWIKLGLFLAREASRDVADDEDTRTAIDAQSFEDGLAITRDLEHLAGLDTSEDPLGDTDLQPHELDTVHREIILSWPHQIIMFDRGAERTPIDLTSYQRMALTEVLDGVDSMTADHMFAFSYTPIRRGPGNYISHVTEVPARLVQRLLRERGPLFLENQYPLVGKS